MLTSLTVNGTVLSTDMLEDTSFPNATMRESALRDFRAFGREVPDAHEDASFRVTVKVKASAPSGAVGLISDRVRLFTPGASIVWSEEGAPALTTHIRNAAPVDSRVFADGWGYVTIEGTRTPEWRLPSRPATDASGNAISARLIALPSTTIVSGSVGETYGFVKAKVTLASGGSRICVGVKPSPASGYDPTVATTSGTADARARHGFTNLLTPTNASWSDFTAMFTGQASAYRDEYEVWARMAYGDGASKNRVVSVVSGAGIADTDSYIGQSVLATGTDGYHLDCLGVVPIPAVELPESIDFACALKMQALGSVPSGYDSGVDTIAAIPTLLSCTAAGTFAAGQGALFDYTSHRADRRLAFLTTATSGTAGGVLSLRHPPGSFGLWMPPDDSAWVIEADTGVSEPSTDALLTLEYEPVIINRAGGA